MQVVVDSLLISYEQVGKGDQVMLLLHGWRSNKETFTGLAKQFSKKYRVIAVDLPGFGASQKPAEAWGIPEFSTFIPSFLRKIKTEQVDVIVGHSMGGRIAVYGLGEGILQTDKLILLGAAGFKESSSAKNQAFKVVAKTGKALTKPLPKKVQNRLKGKLYSAAGSDDYLKAGELGETLKKIIDLDLTEVARKVKTPALLIYGENDELTPPVYGQRYNELIQNSQLHVIKEAGHYVHLDQAGQVNQLITDFLK